MTPFEVVLGRAIGRSGMSLRQIEERSGVDWSQIGKFARGERKPRRETVEALADALAGYVSREELLVSAGFAPTDDQAGLVRQFLALSARDKRKALEAVVHDALFERHGDEEPGDGAGPKEGKSRTEGDAHP